MMSDEDKESEEGKESFKQGVEQLKLVIKLTVVRNIDSTTVLY